MPDYTPLVPTSTWANISTTDADWASANPKLLKNFLGQIQLIRTFEEVVLELASEGLVHGPAHSSIGQEGGAVGSIFGLRSSDGINGSHRGHHQFLAKAISYVQPDMDDFESLLNEKTYEVLYRTLAEILGLAPGYCHGRGGSMHLQWLEAGALGTNAIVGGGVPLAAGNAWAQRASGTSDVTVTYFGDGATNIGSVLETMNLAAAWKLPLIFFIENNLYAVSTHVDEVTAESRLSARGQGFGIPALRVDGMDPLAVHLAMNEALEHARNGNGPFIIEAETYRFFHQNGPFAGSAFGYRDKAEEAAWRERDPLDRVLRELQKRGAINSADATSVRDQVRDTLDAITAQLLEADPDKPGKRRIRPELWPSVEFVNVGIRGDANELESMSILEPNTYDGQLIESRFVDVVSRVMERRMELDERIVILGEDIHRLKGGTNGATRGLPERFPGRVLGTPISENAFVGLGGGLAMDTRYVPVIELMYPDFIWVAADQLFNQIGKARHMFGGDNPMPLVVRTKVAIGSGYGSQHLMDPAGIMSTSPGWRIVAPSCAADYIGLMNAALALQDPVLVIEHIDLYQRRDMVPADQLDYVISPRTAALRREGSDATVISYLAMVQQCEEALDVSGLNADLIDLRWLDRASLDWETIGDSIRKTNAVIIVEQGASGTSYGAWLADEIQRRFFDWLDQPVARVTGREASPSISKVLERAAVAGTNEIVTAFANLHAAMGGTE